jgi:hypothetical protein
LQNPSTACQVLFRGLGRGLHRSESTARPLSISVMGLGLVAWLRRITQHQLVRSKSLPGVSSPLESHKMLDIATIVSDIRSLTSIMSGTRAKTLSSAVTAPNARRRERPKGDGCRGKHSCLCLRNVPTFFSSLKLSFRLPHGSPPAPDASPSRMSRPLPWHLDSLGVCSTAEAREPHASTRPELLSADHSHENGPAAELGIYRTVWECALNNGTLPPRD